jgi:uncharacterized protein
MWPVKGQWLALLAMSTLISLGWSAAGLPAALLLGPMISGIVFGVHDFRLEVPRWTYLGAQAVIGAMVSATITPTILATFKQGYPLFCMVVACSVLAASSLGWVISRTGLIPGATAVYGTSPGAASAMVVLAEAEGADVRMVAFMQYSRVLLVALSAAVVARVWLGANSVHNPGTPWLASVQWENLALVLLLAGTGQRIAKQLRLQAWALLGPMLLLSVLHAGGWIEIALPRWLLALAYAMLGWHIGLGFRRDALRHVGRTLPVVIGAALALMIFCGILAWALVRLAHIDPLTAYLATSPGGLDSVAVIAASTPGSDLSFVLALQSVRLVLTIALSPVIARLVVRYSPHLRVGRN